MRKPPIIILLFFTTFCFAQHQVDPNLFGITAETTFIFYDVDDTSFTNKVLQISPKILTFPGSNFYHFGKVGYGFDLDEIDAWHKKGYPKRVRGLLRNTQQRGHNHDYIDDFIKLARKTKSKAIIMANIITAKPEETIQIIKKIKENGVDIVGVEMGGELSNESYKHRMDYQRYISLAKKHAEEIKYHYPNLKIAVVAAPLVYWKGHRHISWNNELAKETFYDGIIFHNYVQVTNGKDKEGNMISEIVAGKDKNEAFKVYKEKVLDFFSHDFVKAITRYNEIFNFKEIWITEWNLQYSNITGNTLFQGLFTANYLLEMLANSSLQQIKIAAFHNLGGRDYGGSIFMVGNNKSEVQSTFHPIRMLAEISFDSTLIISKHAMSNELFKYTVENKDQKVRYNFYLNWSDSDKEIIIFDAHNRISSVVEYYGEKLFSLNDKNDEIFCKKTKVSSIDRWTILPNSFTLIKSIKK